MFRQFNLRKSFLGAAHPPLLKNLKSSQDKTDSVEEGTHNGVVVETTLGEGILEAVASSTNTIIMVITLITIIRTNQTLLIIMSRDPSIGTTIQITSHNSMEVATGEANLQEEATIKIKMTVI